MTAMMTSFHTQQSESESKRSVCRVNMQQRPSVHSFLLDQELISHIVTHIVILLFVLVWRPLQKALGSVVSNLIRMKFDRILFRVNL